MFLFVASPHSEEGLCLYTKCASVETSVYPDKWEGCAHVIRITTPFVTYVTNGRPKSAPGAHWSPQFMCCLRCFMFECGVCVTILSCLCACDMLWSVFKSVCVRLAVGLATLSC